MFPPGDETLRYPVMEVGVAIVAGAGPATVFEAPLPNTCLRFALDGGRPKRIL